MRVKTTIKFEVEYPLALEFYETEDEDMALQMERACVVEDPVGIIDAFEARGSGTFTTSVEIVDLSPVAKVTKTWIDGTYTIKSEGTTEV